MIEIRRATTVLHPGSTRVLGRPHVPGDDPSPDGPSRLERIVALVLELPEPEVEAALAEVREAFTGRHRDLDLMLERNAERVGHLLEGCSPTRRRLVGSYFTQEHAFESAALTNPSMVAAPDQAGVPPGSCRFVLSLRAIGEGHLSSITFRTGTVDARGDVEVDDPGPLVETGERRGAVHERRHFARKLLELGADIGCTGRVMDRLPRHFVTEDLEEALQALDDLPRAVTHESDKLARWLAASNYLLRFDGATTSPAQRLLWPEGPFESRGMEDARFSHAV